MGKTKTGQTPIEASPEEKVKLEKEGASEPKGDDTSARSTTRGNSPTSSTTSSIMESLPLPDEKEVLEERKKREVTADFVTKESSSDELHGDFNRGLLINLLFFDIKAIEDQDKVLWEQLGITKEEIENLVYHYTQGLAFASAIKQFYLPDNNFFTILRDNLGDSCSLKISPRFNLYKKDNSSSEIFLDIYNAAFIQITEDAFIPLPGLIKLSFKLDLKAPAIKEKPRGHAWTYLGCTQEKTQAESSYLTQEDQLLARILTNDPPITKYNEIIAIYKKLLSYKNTRLKPESRIEIPKTLDLASFSEIDTQLDYAYILQLIQQTIDTAKRQQGGLYKLSYNINKLLSTPGFRKEDAKEQLQHLASLAEFFLNSEKTLNEFDRKLANTIIHIYPPLIEPGKPIPDTTSPVDTTSARKRTINFLEDLLVSKELTEIITADAYWQDGKGDIFKFIKALQVEIEKPEFKQLIPAAQLAILHDTAMQYSKKDLSKQELILHSALINPTLHPDDSSLVKLYKNVATLNIYCNEILTLLTDFVEDTEWWKLFNKEKVPQPIMGLRKKIMHPEFNLLSPMTKIQVLHKLAADIIEHQTPSVFEHIQARNIFLKLQQMPIDSTKRQLSLDALQELYSAYMNFSALKQEFNEYNKIFFKYLETIVEKETFSEPKPLLLIKLHEFFADPAFKNNTIATKMKLFRQCIEYPDLKTKQNAVKNKAANNFCKELEKIFNFTKQEPFIAMDEDLTKLEILAQKHLKIILHEECDTISEDASPRSQSSSPRGVIN